MDCTLKVCALSVGWDHPLISGIELMLPPGETLAIIGESGCGKSTLLKTLAGLKPPISGRVDWLSDEIRVTPRRAMVFQDLALLPWKSVWDNLALPLMLAKEPEIGERVRAMLQEMELEEFADRYPAELSGGQRQRLALGRAFISRPDVLFMDEPFSALDAILRERLQDFLKAQWRKYRCSMILVTHDIAEAVFLGQHIMLMGARPSRVAALAENSAFDTVTGDLRGHESFYRVERHLHEALAAVRAGREVTPGPEGKW